MSATDVSTPPRLVTPGLGFPLRPEPSTSALGWPGADMADRRAALIDRYRRRLTEEPPQEEPETPGDASAGGEDAAPGPGSAPSATGWDAPDVSRETPSEPSRETPIEPATAPGDPVADVSRETPSEPGAAPGDPAGDVSRETTTRVALADSLPQGDAESPLAQAVAADARKRIILTGRTLPRPEHPRVLTVANQKGGVGKTTTAVNIAAALARGGARVLVIDLDPQGNASTALGIDHHSDVDSIYDALLDGMPLADVVRPTPEVPGLLCAPATIDLAGAEIELVGLEARESRLAAAIAAYLDTMEAAGERVDYVFIDCPPSLGLLTVNAFVAAREVLIPIQCEYYALEGLSALLRNIDLIRAHLNPALRVSSILLTMSDGRTRLSAQVADEVRAHFPDETLAAVIPRSVRISEAPSFGQTVIAYDPSSSGALAYLEAAAELAERAARRKDGP